MTDKATGYFSAEEETRITEAIRQAELLTSGEIRVHVEDHDRGDTLARAKKVFEELGMTRTSARNGVLFYLAWKDHRFAILGDRGINEKVPEGFWASTRDHLTENFKAGRFADGLAAGIAEAGEQLAKHFPRQGNDKNELPDHISTS